MPSTFGPLQLGLSGLQAQQIGLDVTGQNVANVNTPGYNRQEAVLTDSPPTPNTPGELGTGVTVAQITQARDTFVNQQFRNQQSGLSQWQAAQNGLNEIQAIYNEPSATAISGVLSQFWSSLQQLAGNPESLATRTTVAQQGQNLASSINTVYSKLQDLQGNLNNQVGAIVQQVNTDASQIAALNGEIEAVTGGGQTANDLISQRANLLDQLSKLTGVQVTQETNGSVQVDSGGGTLVFGSTAHSLAAVTPTGSNLSRVVWGASGVAFNTAAGGQLAGTITLRDTTIPGLQSQLNTFAANLASEMNTLQQNGYALNANSPSGINFFNVTAGSEAASIAVNPAVTADPTQIAAASNPSAPGDGSNAQNMADLATTTVPALGNSSVGDYYNATISGLGIQAQTANQMVTNGQALVTQMTNQRQAVSGVSLDQEATNLVTYQQAYGAAADFINTVNTLLNTLIQTVG